MTVDLGDRFDHGTATGDRRTLVPSLYRAPTGSGVVMITLSQAAASVIQELAGRCIAMSKMVRSPKPGIAAASSSPSTNSVSLPMPVCECVNVSVHSVSRPWMTSLSIVVIALPWRT